MSVSKLWSMISGMEGARRGTKGEEFTHQYLGKLAKELDAAVGYTANGGRAEAPKPKEGTIERVRDYERVGEERKHPVIAGEAGRCTVQVTDDLGNRLIAEIKLFPAEGKTEAESFDFSAPMRDYFRRYTDRQGRFSMELAAGIYRLEASKGSEYSIAGTAVEIRAGEETVTELVLHRFVDLTEQCWYAGDLHHHSVYSSPLFPPQGTDYVYDTPQIVADSMQAMGLTYGALSDHHNVLNHREWEACKTEDFLPILSKEISTSNGHVLALNTDPDVIYRIPTEKERTQDYLRQEYLRVTKEICSYGGHPQINHPRDMQKAISFPEEFTDMIEIFHTIEIWNGSHPMEKGTTNDQAMELWLSLLEENRFIAATTGSDTHEVSLEFWLDSFGYVFGLYQAVKEHYGELSDEDKKKADWFLGMLTPQLPLVAEWGRRNLTSGCVRTYVHAAGEKTPENLLSHLKKGNSFVTNGPILMVSLPGAEMGETAKYPVDATELTAKLTVLSNRPLTKLLIHKNGRRTEEFPLPEAECENGCYDYSGEVRIAANDAKWLIFQVKGNCTNQAITNPIFLEAE